MDQNQRLYSNAREAQRNRGAYSQAAFQHLAANGAVDLFERDPSLPRPRGFELLRAHIDSLNNDQDKADLEYVSTFHNEQIRWLRERWVWELWVERDSRERRCNSNFKPNALQET
jgi:hypothetical protein